MKTTIPQTFTPYQQRCVDACSTVEGAEALAASLTTGYGLGSPHWRRRVASQQAEMAKKAAEHAKLTTELYSRLPAVYLQAEAKANSNVQEAGSAVAHAEGFVATARVRVNDFTAQVVSLKSGIDDAAACAASGLEAAQARLSAAEAKEDMKAVAKASGELVAAREEQSRIVASQGANFVQMASAQNLLNKANDELSGALGALDDATANHRQALASYNAVKADQAMLDALSAHSKWARASRQLKGFVGDKCPGFFFVDGERAPYWDGKPGPKLVNTWDLQRLRDALDEPLWEVFADDPAQLAEPL